MLLAVAVVSSGLSSIPALAQDAPERGAANVEKTPSPPSGPTDEERGVHQERSQGGHGRPDHATFPDPQHGQGRYKAVEGLEEVESLRSAGMKVFRMPGAQGAHVAQIFSGPVHYKGADGTWQEIDSSLVPVEGGYSNAANSFDVFFPDRIGSASPVIIGGRNHSTKITMLDVGDAKGRVDGPKVVYERVHKDTDLEYVVTEAGLKENLVLASDKAPSTFRFGIETPLELVVVEGSHIEARDGDTVVGVFPAPFVQDAPGDDGVPAEANHEAVTTDLVETSEGVHELTMAIDEGWLASEDRRFPVKLDPTWVDSLCQPNCAKDFGAPLLKDITVNESGYRDLYNQYLEVSRGGGFYENGYMTFDVAQQIRKIGDLIYSAKFDMYNVGTGGLNPGPYEIKRITADWDGTAAWGPAPSVDETKVWSTRFVSGFPAWMTWDVKGIMQWWMDKGIPTNHGWRVAARSDANGWTNFYSKDGPTWAMPYITVLVNAMPSTRPLVVDDPSWPYLDLATDAPANGTKFSGSNPVLKIQDLTDVNGDGIVVRYQVSTSPTDFSPSKVVWDSNWIPKKLSQPVPIDGLASGTYYWRVQASDQCMGNQAAYVDPDPLDYAANLCDDLSHDLQRPNAGQNERPTSEVRSFVLESSRVRRGFDQRWAMWRQELGNGMTLMVDQASGNLVLDYPVDSLMTKAGPLDVGLSYNSGDAHDGKGHPGLPAGWELSAGPGGRPGQIPVRVVPSSPFAAQVQLESGRRDSYVSTDGIVFKTLGPAAGTLRKNGNGTWQLTTYNGGMFTFAANGELVQARPQTSTVEAPGFRYDFGGDPKIDWVKDLKSGRRTLFGYGSNGRLSTITTWVTGGIWNFGYDGSNRLTSITDPEGGKVELDYINGRLTSVKDAAQVASGGPASAITYLDRNGKPLVETVALPGGTNHWKFEYTFPTTTGTLAMTTAVTDPRGIATGADHDDFKVITDFDVNGFPIMTRGPYVPTQGWPVERWRWNEHDNLVCQRDAAANAISNIPCTREAAVSGADALQTEYKYQPRAPYLVTEVREPARNAGGIALGRRVTTFRYDADITGFEGLQTQYYENQHLEGLPSRVSVGQNAWESWGTGSPFYPSITDNWGVRYFGEYVTGQYTGDQTFKFRVNVDVDDKVRLAVGDKVIVDCWATNVPCTSTGSVSLKSGRHPLTLEFADVSGAAKMQLEHEVGGVYKDISTSWLAPNLDALTNVAVKSDTGTTLRLTDYRYASPIDKIRRLPSNEIDWNGHFTKRTYLSYNDFGEVTERTDQNTDGLTVKHLFDDNGCNYWTGEGTTSSQTVITTRTCNERGQVKRETRTIGGMIRADGTTFSQDRVTTTSYDNLGRVTSVGNADGGGADFTYDEAGRVVRETLKVSSAETRVTDIAYNAQGWLVKETLPRPNAVDPRPEVEYSYDGVGNRTGMIDQLDNAWSYTYNPLSLRTSKKNPLGETWTWEYDVAGRNVKSARPPLVAGQTSSAVVTKTYDALGRVTSRRLGALAETKFQYNLQSHLIEKTDPDGVVTSWTVDGDGNKLSETRKVGTSGAAATRRLFYSDRGLVREETDFRGNSTKYTYDRWSRLTSVTMPHAAPNVTRYTYNDAGEVEKVQLPKVGAETIDEAYDYDNMGRVVAERDGLGHETTYAYNWASQATSSTSARDFVSAYKYDGGGRKVSATASYNGAQVSKKTFGYDAAGHMTSASEGSRTVSVSYDFAGRVDVVSTGQDATNYDYVGDTIVGRTDEAGVTLYDYVNATGRLASVKTPMSDTRAEFTFTPAGRIEIRKDPNGITTRFTYDAAGRLVSQRSTRPDNSVVSEFAQAWDADSHVLSRTNQVDTGTDNGQWTYEYDTAGRLKKAADPSGSLTTYEYDGAGNRTKVVNETTTAGSLNKTTSETRFDLGGRAIDMTTTKQTDPLPATTTVTDYDYDDDGNLTKIDDGTTKWAYEYDPWNRMASAKKSLSALEIPVSSIYTYDALDRTISRGTTLTSPAGEVTVQGEQASYAGLSDALVSSDIVAEIAGVSTTKTGTVYAYAAGMPIAMARRAEVETVGMPEIEVAEAVRFVGSTPHNDVSFLTDAAGLVVSTRSYDPWGEVRSAVGEQAELGYQGDPTDEDTGLVDMGARYYLPSLGRFTSEDLNTGDLSTPLSLNGYAYGLDDPVSNFDPTGYTANKAAGGGGCDCTDQSGGSSSDSGGSSSGEVLPTPNPSPGPCKDHACVTVTMAANTAASRMRTGPSFWERMLDLSGFIPLLGDAIDGIRCGVETATGPTLDTGLMCASTIPGPTGWTTSGVRMGRRTFNAAAETSGAAGKILSRIPVDELWGRPETLAKHFSDHAARMGIKTLDEYVRKSSEFLQRGLKEGYEVRVDSDGIIRMWDPSTNTFGSYNPDGTTATFFSPTSPTYWARNVHRYGSEPWSL